MDNHLFAIYWSILYPTPSEKHNGWWLSEKSTSVRWDNHILCHALNPKTWSQNRCDLASVFWLVVEPGIPTPLKNDGVKVSWGYSSQYMENLKPCSKPPTSYCPSSGGYDIVWRAGSNIQTKPQNRFFIHQCQNEQKRPSKWKRAGTGVWLRMG